MGDGNPIGAGILFITQNSTVNSTAIFIMPYIGNAYELTNSNGFFTVGDDGFIKVEKSGYKWVLTNLKNNVVSDISFTTIRLSIV